MPGQKPKLTFADSVVIFANGPLPPEEFVKKYVENPDLIVCADGGANRIIDWKIKPDVLIGDFDSVSKETLLELGDIALVRRPEQDTTDLQKALDYVDSRSNGECTVLVFGATGERPDHFLGNISLLPYYQKRLEIEFIDEKYTIKLVGKQLSISGEPGKTVSLWSLSEKATGVTTTGLKYNLKNKTILQGTMGISNELDEPEATVKVRSGNLLAIIHH